MRDDWTRDLQELTHRYTNTGVGATAHNYFLRNPTRDCSCSAGAVLIDAQLQACPICKGLGYVAMTDDEIREEYQAARARVVLASKLTARDFNEQAAKIVVRESSDPTPGLWLTAARVIEAEYAKRRKEARSRW